MLTTQENSYVCDISWKAIICGMLVACGLTLHFNVLTAGIGLSLFTPNTEGLNQLATGVLAWTLIGGFIILFISGWVTGMHKCRVCPTSKCNGVLHGFIAWTLYALFSIFMTAYLAKAAGTLAYVKHAFMAFNWPEARPNMDAIEMTQTTGQAALVLFSVFAVGMLGFVTGAYQGTKRGRVCYQHNAINPNVDPMRKL